MSQQGRLRDIPTALETLTGNSGGVVLPDAAGNIDIVGGSTATVTGNPGTTTLTIEVGAVVATSFDTDSGTAIPAANVIKVLGGTNMNSTGATNVITINLDLDVLGLTDLTVDNLELNGNTLSTTDLNGSLSITPNGTGGVIIPTNLTLGRAIQDVTFTINGVSISSVVAVHTEGVTDLGGFTNQRHSDTAALGVHNIFLRSQGSEATPTIVADNDILSRLVSGGFDGTDYARSSEIRAEVDGTPGANDMPGRILLCTSVDGGQTPLEGFRLDSSQEVFMKTAEIDHTATEADDHALEIVCLAGGFGDVKALDIDYVTGALAAGDDAEAILVNIDESASSGGTVSGYEVIATAEGGATINGYVTGININPILHNAGTFGNIDNILNIAVDVTAALASGGAGNISAFVADNDTMTFGDAAKWNEMEVIVDTPASGGGIAPTFEFSTGGAGFTAFVPADGTNGLRNSGAILWVEADLVGWATNASGRFEIRQTRTRNSLTTTPILDEVQLSSTTEFIWDVNGDVNINSLTLVTPLTPANGGRLTWNEETGTSATMVVNNGYITNNAGLVTMTLPATAAVGDTIKVDGKGAGGWLIAQNAGQTVNFLAQPTTTGVGGSLASSTQYDCVTYRCITANTTWVVEAVVGNLTVV